MSDAANVSQTVGLSVLTSVLIVAFTQRVFTARFSFRRSQILSKSAASCVGNLAPYLLRRAGETFALRTRGDDEQMVSIFWRFDGLSHFFRVFIGTDGFLAWNDSNMSPESVGRSSSNCFIS